MPDQETLDELADARQRSRELHRESRRVLVQAVRRAALAGHSQRQIASAAGLSQPEVSRLLRHQPSSPRGRKLASHRREVIAAASDAGFTNVRVFGSVARGDDGAESDIDLLVTAPPNVSLFAIARLENLISELLGEQVEVTLDSSLKPFLADRVHDEAMPL